MSYRCPFVRALATLVLLGVLVVFSSCTSTDGSTERSDCEELLEHEIELRLQALGDLPVARVEAHRQNLASTNGHYVEQCQQRWSADRIACGLSAGDREQLQDCARRN